MYQVRYKRILVCLHKILSIDKNPKTDSRMVMAGAGENGSCVTKMKNVLGISGGVSMNVPQTTELYTAKWLIKCNFMDIYHNKEYKKKAFNLLEPP